MKILQRFLFVGVITTGLSIGAFAQKKDEKKEPPPKPIPPVVKPQPKDKPKKPDKPDYEMALYWREEMDDFA